MRLFDQRSSAGHDGRRETGAIGRGVAVIAVQQTEWIVLLRGHVKPRIGVQIAVGRVRRQENIQPTGCHDFRLDRAISRIRPEGGIAGKLVGDYRRRELEGLAIGIDVYLDAGEIDASPSGPGAMPGNS